MINVSKQYFYISIGGGWGLRMCLMLAPGCEGLNGAWHPYGLGRGSSVSLSGM